MTPPRAPGPRPLDPELVLARARRLSRRLEREDSYLDEMAPMELQRYRENVVALATLFGELDWWLSEGGLLPSAWRHPLTDEALRILAALIEIHDGRPADETERADLMTRARNLLVNRVVVPRE